MSQFALRIGGIPLIAGLIWVVLCLPGMARASSGPTVKRVDVGRVKAGACEAGAAKAGGCAWLDFTLHTQQARATKRQKLSLLVDANLLSRLRSAAGKADSAALPRISRALVDGLSSRASSVRAACGEALIAVGERRGWRCVVLEGGVDVPKTKRRLLQRIGCSYQAAGGHPIVVTSGTRSTADQAGALDQKIRAGDRNLSVYKNRVAAKELLNAWKSAGKSRQNQRAALKKALDRQIKAGIYISQHLRAGAVDVRSLGMNSKQKSAFKRAVGSVPGAHVIEERKPPHFHVELP